MYRDGYLVRCCGPCFDVPVLYFCVFDEGRMALYTERGGQLVSEIVLAGCVTQVRVERLVASKMPHRFSLSVRTVLRVEGRRMKMAEAKTFQFAAPTNDLMKEWANTLHLWRRMNWKEHVKFFANAVEIDPTEERALLLLHLRQYQDRKARRHALPTTNGMALARLKNLLALHPQLSPASKKFRHRADSTATQTSSCATTATATAG